MKKRVVIILMVLFLVGSVSAADYIVPLEMGLVDLNTFPGINSGDRLLLEPGERGTLQLKSLKGEQDNPIIVINNGGIVDVNANDTWVGIWFRNSEHIRITGTGSADEYGIRIHNSANVGIAGTEKTRHLEIDHLEITDVNIGVSAKTSKDINGDPVLYGAWVQYNTTIHDCYIHDVNGEGMYVGGSYWKDSPELDGVYVYNNIINSPGYECIQVGSAPNNVEVHHNTCTNAGGSDEGNPPIGANSQSGMIINKGTTGDWYNNKIIGSGRNGIITIGVGEYDFYNNLIINSGSGGINGDGIRVWGKDGLYRYNTIINSLNYGINIISGTGAVRDNIIAGYGSNAVYGTSILKENNFETNDINSVGFVDSSNNDFHLQATSIAIDNGSSLDFPDFDFDGITRPQGTAPDIGAYEYQGTVAPTCQSLGYDCCDSCQSGPHPEYDADCSGQVCCEVCYVPTSSSLANSDTMIANSNNFALDHPVEHLWDGCADGTSECTSGAGDIASFWVEFDFGQNYNLNLTRLFGDAVGNWISTSWTFQYKINSEDSWTTAFSGENALVNDWITQNINLIARYVRVEVFGNQDVPATQARELEIYGTVASSTCSSADTNTDGTVDIVEILAYMAQWKAGTVSIENLMIGIGEWKNGC